MPARCFVIERQNDKDSPANLKDFGEIVYIFKAGQDRPSVFDTDRMSESILEALNANKFCAASDFLVVSGSLNMMANLVAVAVNNFGVCDALMFEFSSKKYRQVEIG